MSTLTRFKEELPVRVRHDVYPFIDPTQHYRNQTFKGKVALITGASRGIGRESAVQFGRAGANVVLVARTETALAETKDMILQAMPEAQVLTFSANVTDTERAKEIMETIIAKFGRLDILIANAGIIRAADASFTQKDPLGWWEVVEVNLRGIYNYTHFAIPNLKKTSGALIVTSTSTSIQIRVPYTSEYSISKLALNCLVEFIALEHPDIRTFSVHPGAIDTYAAKVAGIDSYKKEDTLALPAAVYLFLSSGGAPYLSGRYVSATWDLEEVERDWKDQIIEQNSLVAKLSIPVRTPRPSRSTRGFCSLQ